MPGFTHPVTDVYLDEILGIVGYASRTRPSSTAAQQNGAHASLEVQGAVQEAIMNAFLTGSDDAFELLLEVWHGWREWYYSESLRC